MPVTIVSHYEADRAVGDLNYKGLRIHARKGLHEYVADLVPPGSTVLDLASGTGALAQRLADKGCDVTCTDYVVSNFKANLPFFQADLNEPLVLDRTFDYVTCVELIEHIENPRALMRNIVKLAKRFIVTTPNLENPVSKAMFVRSGLFQWFQDGNYTTDGHITPLSRWQLEKVFQEVGLKAEFSSFGDPYESAWPMVKVAARLIDLVSEGEKGEILVAVTK